MVYQVEEARRIIADHGFIGRVSAQGGMLVVYEGEEHSPGTWMEIGRLGIRNGTVMGSDIERIVA